MFFVYVIHLWHAYSNECLSSDIYIVSNIDGIFNENKKYGSSALNAEHGWEKSKKFVLFVCLT